MPEGYRKRHLYTLVDFDSVSFLVLQQHFICDHSGLAYVRRKQNVRIAMHTCVTVSKA